jgi:hypothetical protein
MTQMLQRPTKAIAEGAIAEEKECNQMGCPYFPQGQKKLAHGVIIVI